jgi:hypothetical protein
MMQKTEGVSSFSLATKELCLRLDRSQAEGILTFSNVHIRFLWLRHTACCSPRTYTDILEPQAPGQQFTGLGEFEAEWHRVLLCAPITQGLLMKPLQHRLPDWRLAGNTGLIVRKYTHRLSSVQDQKAEVGSGGRGGGGSDGRVGGGSGGRVGAGLGFGLGFGLGVGVGSGVGVGGTGVLVEVGGTGVAVGEGTGVGVTVGRGVDAGGTGVEATVVGATVGVGVGNSNSLILSSSVLTVSSSASISLLCIVTLTASSVAVASIISM